jgi:hypothetical protein
MCAANVPKAKCKTGVSYFLLGNYMKPISVDLVSSLLTLHKVRPHKCN